MRPIPGIDITDDQYACVQAIVARENAQRQDGAGPWTVETYCQQRLLETVESYEREERHTLKRVAAKELDDLSLAQLKAKAAAQEVKPLADDAALPLDATP